MDKGSRRAPPTSPRPPAAAAAVLPSLNADDARLMGRPAGSAMLHLTRVARDAEGRPVEYVESLLDPARFRLHLRFGL